MLISGKGDVLNLFSLAFHYPIKNRHAVRADLSVGVDLNIEEALAAEVLDQVLPAFLNHLGSEAVLLVNRQQFVFVPGPEVRALHGGVNHGAGMNLEVDIREI